MNTQKNRRPLKARGWKFIERGAELLGKKNVTPNQISLASIGFSALAALCLLLLPEKEGALLWIAAIIFVLLLLCRALCNIFDGLVAIEGGKSTKSGELFNDIPDRIADVLIIVAAGYAAAFPALGWLAALLAVMTAYVRTLSRSVGAPSDFRGPMAKVARMALILIAVLLTPFKADGPFLLIALILIILGCIVTIWNRAKAAYLYLESKDDV